MIGAVAGLQSAANTISQKFNTCAYYGTSVKDWYRT